ncbi:MAG: hypothetical protein AABY22_27260 [Nanoarchaeota archaeon]
MNIDNKTMDWHLFWTAAGVILTLGALVFGCFKSLNNTMVSLDKRLTVIETVMVMNGYNIKGIATNKSEDK